MVAAFTYTIRFYQRILLGKVMGYFETEGISTGAALAYGTASLLLDTLGQTLLLPYFYGWCKLVALKVRVALIAVIFKKMLRLSPRAASMVGTGHIITLCTSELQRLDTYCAFMFSVFAFAILVILVMLDVAWTPEGQAGLVMGIVMAGVSSSLAYPISIFAKRRDTATDARMQLI